MACFNSSSVTNTMSLTSWRMISKVSSAGSRVASPSAMVATPSCFTTAPVLKDSATAGAPVDCTPMT